ATASTRIGPELAAPAAPTPIPPAAIAVVPTTPTSPAAIILPLPFRRLRAGDVSSLIVKPPLSECPERSLRGICRCPVGGPTALHDLKSADDYEYFWVMPPSPTSTVRPTAVRLTALRPTAGASTAPAPAFSPTAALPGAPADQPTAASSTPANSSGSDFRSRRKFASHMFGRKYFWYCRRPRSTSATGNSSPPMASASRW